MKKRLSFFTPIGYFLVLFFLGTSLFAQTSIHLPWSNPSTSSNLGTVTYKFEEVPGEFYYNTSAGGTYNSLCKSSFWIQYSVDGSNWNDIVYLRNKFGVSGTILLNKDVRYVRATFNKCGTNSQWVKFNAGSWVSKSINADESTVDFGNVVIGDYVEKIIKVNWAANVANNILVSVNHPDYTIVGLNNNTITVVPGSSGSRNIRVRYKAVAVGNSTAELRFKEENYSTNFENVSLSGTGTAHTPPVLFPAFDKKNTAFSINWSEVAQAQSYEIDLYRKDGENKIYVGGYQNYNTDLLRNYDFKDLTPDQTYFMVARSINGSYKSANSNEVEITLESFFNISLSSANPEMGSVNEIGLVKMGSQVSAKASSFPNCAFVEWRENGMFLSNQPDYGFTITKERSLQAHFVSTLKEVAASVDPAGSGSVRGTGLYNIETEVILTAIPAHGYSFVCWRNDKGIIISEDPIMNIRVSDNVHYVAYFSANNYQVYIIANNGRVEGAGEYRFGEDVCLQVFPDDYYLFESYTESGKVLSTDPNFCLKVSGEHHITANFAHRGFAVSLSKTPNEGGNVSGGGLVEKGNSVTVKSVPNADFNFGGWFDTLAFAYVDANESYTFFPDKDIHLEGRFAYANTKQLPYALPSDEYFGGSKTITYFFPEIPGEFSYRFTAGGTYNALCKSNLKMQWSSNGSQWYTIFNLENSFTPSATITLDKSAHYIRIAWDKCGTNSQNTTFKANSIIEKSIDCDINSLDFGTVVLGDSVEKNVIVYWAPNLEDNILTSILQTDEVEIIRSSEIEVQPGFKGNRVLTLRYKPKNVGILLGRLVLNEKQYTDNEDNVLLNARAIAQTPPVLNPPKNLTNKSFEIDWNSTLFAQGYEFDLYKKDASGNKSYIGTYQNYSTATKCNFTFESLPPDQIYYMVVRGLYNGIKTASSNEQKIVLESYFKIELISANPEMGSVNAEDKEKVKIGTSLTAKAVPFALCEFVAWKEGGQVVSTDLNYSFIVDTNRRLEAHFISLQKEVTAYIIPSTGGSVSGGGLYEADNEVTLRAVAAEGYTFSHWSSRGLTDTLSHSVEYRFTITENIAFDAHFKINTYYVEVFPSDKGTIKGEGIYQYGETVTLTSTPKDSYYIFDSYVENGIVVSTNPIYSFVITKNRSIIPNYSHRGFDISVSALPVEGGNVTGAKTYIEGQTAVLNASPSANFKFVGWYEEMDSLSNNPNYLFVPERDMDIFARFAYDNEVSLPYTFTSDIKFSGSQSITYFFADVPGEFYYNFTGGGSYNALCKSSFTIQTSINGSQWTAIRSENKDFDFSGRLTLAKEVRYLRFTFNKCGTNDQNITLKAGSYIKKSINASPDVLNFGEIYADAESQSYELNISWDKNITGTSGKLLLECENPHYRFSQTQITAINGYAGSERIMVSYIPDTQGIDHAVLRISDQGYPVNYKLIQLKGAAIDSIYDLFTQSCDDLGQEDNTIGSVSGNPLGKYARYTHLRLRALPAEGYHLIAWKENGEIIGYNDSLDISIRSHRNIQALFGPNRYIHQIIAGVGGDAYFIDPITKDSLAKEVRCGHEEDLEIEAFSLFGYVFKDFVTIPYQQPFAQSNPHSYKATQDRYITARFDTAAYAIPVQSNDLTYGKVYINGDTNAPGKYKHFTNCTIRAMAQDYCSFSHWESGAGETIYDSVYTFKVDGARAFTAIFIPQKYKITLQTEGIKAEDIDKVVLSGDGEFLCMDTATYVIEISAPSKYGFLYWQRASDNEVIRENPYTIIEEGRLIQDESYTANYSANIWKISGNSTNGKVSGYGNYVHDSTAYLSAKPDSGYQFVEWTDSDGNNLSMHSSTSVQMDANKTYNAVFAPKTYVINSSVAPDCVGMGTISPALNNSQYSHFEVLQLSALAEDGYEFRYWIEANDTLGNETNLLLTIDRSRSIEAHFSRSRQKFNLSSDPADAGILSGNGLQEYGKTVEIRAQENYGYRFEKWVNLTNSKDFSMRSDTQILADRQYDLSAKFQANPYKIQIETSEGGEIAFYVEGEMKWQENIDSTLLFNQTLYVTARPESHYSFVGWFNDKGDTLYKYSDYIFNVREDMKIRALFTPILYSVSAGTNPAGAAIIQGVGDYPFGTDTSLRIKTKFGYVFSKWQAEGKDISSDSILSLRVDGANPYYIAYFLPLQYEVKTKVEPKDGGFATGGGMYDYSAKAILEATPSQAYRFLAWLGYNEQSGQYDTLRNRPNYYPQVEKNTEYTALFVKKSCALSLTQSDPDASEMKGAGSYLYGDTIIISIRSIGVGFSFLYWQDEKGDSISNLIDLKICLKENRSLHAVFIPSKLQLTVQSEDIKKGNAQGSGTYVCGEYARLLALPDENYTFSHWANAEGEEISQEDAIEWKVLENSVLTAYFSPKSYRLSASAQIPSMGGVQGRQGEFYYESEISLEAVPKYGFRFLYWIHLQDTLKSGPSLRVPLLMNTHYTAVFDTIKYWIGTEVYPSASNLSVTGGDSICYRNTIRLKARSQNPNLVFVAFVRAFDPQAKTESEMEIITYDSVCEWQVTKGEMITAMFKPLPLHLTVSPNHPDYGQTTGSNYYDYLDTAYVYALPKIGYQFSHWEDEAIPLAFGAYASFPLTSNRHLTAVFKRRKCNVNTFSHIKGGTYTSSAVYTYGDTARISAQAKEGYLFKGYYIGKNLVSKDSLYAFVVFDEKEIEVRFEPKQYQISLGTSGGGSVSGGGKYAFNEYAVLRAYFLVSHTFSHWTYKDSIVSTSPVLNWFIQKEDSLTAHFDLNHYQVEVEVFPPMAGVFTGAGEYAHGEQAHLKVSPSKHYLFSHWDVDGRELYAIDSVDFQVLAPIRVRAYFKKDIHEIQILSNYYNAGITQGEGSYFKGDTAYLSAESSDGYVFEEWSHRGEVLSEDSTYNFVVGEARIIVANFRALRYRITARPEPVNGGIVSGEGVYGYAEKIAFSAQARDKYIFSHWEWQGETISQDSILEWTCKRSGEMIAHFIYMKDTVSDPDTIPLPPMNPEGVLEVNVMYNTNEGMLRTYIKNEAESKDDMWMCLYNNQGFRITEGRVQEGITEIYCGKLASGIYICRFRIGSTIISKKVAIITF